MEDQDSETRDQTLGGIVNGLWKIILELSQFGENKNLCSYNRTPPNMDDPTLDVSETDKESYKLYYNIMKNIFEFSITPNVNKLKKQVGTVGEDDEFCCNMAKTFLKVTDE